MDKDRVSKFIYIQRKTIRRLTDRTNCNQPSENNDEQWKDFESSLLEIDAIGNETKG